MAVYSISISRCPQKRPTPDLTGLDGTPNKVTIKPFLDGSVSSFSIYKVAVESEKIITTTSKLFNVEETSIVSTQITSNGVCFSASSDRNILAEYTTEDTVLWILPLMPIYNPKFLEQMLIPIKIEANTLIIHSPGSLGLIAKSTKNRAIKRSYGNEDDIKKFFKQLSQDYQSKVPKVVRCNVDDIRPKYRDLGEWLEDKQNVYIGPVKPVFSATKGENDKKTKFVKHDSPFWLRPDETETEYRKRITQRGPLEFYQNFLGKNLGDWSSTHESHGNIIISEFTMIYLQQYFNF